jgi:hypothetical protein
MLRKAYIYYDPVVMVLLPALKEGSPHLGGSDEVKGNSRVF